MCAAAEEGERPEIFRIYISESFENESHLSNVCSTVLYCTAIIDLITRQEVSVDSTISDKKVPTLHFLVPHHSF